MQEDAKLKKISISGKILGNFFLNEIEQVFVNKSEKNVEFVYTFPMPEDASISSFSAITPTGKYIGVVEEKDKALKIYQDTISKGDSAYMLESYRDNIFQVSLGNVASGEEVTINISYIQDLVIDGVDLRLKIPTLVSPRYIPGLPAGKKQGMGYSEPTTEVPDADFITPVAGETTYRVTFDIAFDLDNEVKDISSPSHEIEKDFAGGKGTVKVKATKANSDFILNFKLAGSHIEKMFISEPLNNEYFIYTSFVPKFESDSPTDLNKEYIFLIDVSGSMAGQNLDSAKKALKIAMRNLTQGDIFNIIAFESYFECFSEKSIKFSETSFHSANEWIDNLHDKGGTEIFDALQYAVESVDKADKKEKIIMLLTDGQIGNEYEIIKYVKANFTGRVFCVGIDVNVNDSFLNKVSTVGNGYAEFYYPRSKEDLGHLVAKQFARTNAPYLQDIKYELKGDFDVAGKPLKYLYNNECYNMVIKADFPYELLKITGQDCDTEVKIEVPITEKAVNPKLLSQMWAKKKISEMDLNIYDINPRHENIAKNKIVEISKKYGVICPYTGYIAVNEREDKQKDLPAVVAVVVEEPRLMVDASYSGKIAAALIMDNAWDRYEPKKYNASLSKSQFRKASNAILEKRKINLDNFLQTPRFARDKSKNSNTPDPAVISIKLFLELYNKLKKGKLTEKSFAKDIRNEIILLETSEYQINFDMYFEQMDLILSRIEPFITKDDNELFECYHRLLKTLELACEKYINDLKLADLALKQNFDGSFFLCPALKAKFSQVVLKRLQNDTDGYIYQKQIDKVIDYLKDEHK